MDTKAGKRKRDPSPDPEDADESSSSEEESIGDQNVTRIGAKYEVEKILQKRIRGHKWEYYVKWKGYPDDDNTWIFFYDLLDYRDLIKQFEERDDTIRRQHRSSVLAPMSVILGGRKIKPHSAFEKSDPKQEVPEFEIERVLDVKTIGGKQEFLIKWVGWPDSSNSWEPEENFAACPDIIKDFFRGLEAKLHSASENKSVKHEPLNSDLKCDSSLEAENVVSEVSDSNGTTLYHGKWKGSNLTDCFNEKFLRKCFPDVSEKFKDGHKLDELKINFRLK